jgi:hypothetical protein
VLVLSIKWSFGWLQILFKRGQTGQMTNHKTKKTAHILANVKINDKMNIAFCFFQCSKNYFSDC